MKGKGIAVHGTHSKQERDVAGGDGDSKKKELQLPGSLEWSSVSHEDEGDNNSKDRPSERERKKLFCLALAKMKLQLQSTIHHQDHSNGSWLWFV